MTNEQSKENIMESALNCKFNDVWSLYFHAKNAEKKYNDNTTKLIDIDNIKDFWGTFNNIPKPSKMFSEPGVPQKVLKRTGEIPNALSLFRYGSFPTWEDPTNIKGFEWSIRRHTNFEQLNELWYNLISKVVCENYEHSDVLNGVRFVDCSIDNKVIYRIEVWFSSKKYKEYFETKIKDIMELPHHTKLLYREHSTLKETKPEKTTFEFTSNNNNYTKYYKNYQRYNNNNNNSFNSSSSNFFPFPQSQEN